MVDVNKLKSAVKTVQHRFSHYRFEIEIDPNDDPEGLMKDIDEQHLD